MDFCAERFPSSLDLGLHYEVVWVIGLDHRLVWMGRTSLEDRDGLGRALAPPGSNWGGLGITSWIKAWDIQSFGITSFKVFFMFFFFESWLNKDNSWMIGVWKHIEGLLWVVKFLLHTKDVINFPLKKKEKKNKKC